ncbi:MAG TPA: 6-phosphofructokinase, partial [Thermoleophilia bacterium]|nr:6-phosphofructokinase [Thermoleophilia bacterium]
MATIRRIGILTGGGDVPGLNVAIKAIVDRAAGKGIEVLGLRRGWASMVQNDPRDPSTAAGLTMPLDPESVRRIARTGGTVLHSSRTNPQKVKDSDVPAFVRDEDKTDKGNGVFDLTKHAVRVIQSLGLDALVPIGGEDTLSFAERLHRENVPVVAIPKTMDNDVVGTDYCIGFSTTITRSVDMITNFRTSLGSHERIGVVELFGRNSGATSLYSAYLAGADRAIIPEVPFDVEKLAAFLAADR